MKPDTVVVPLYPECTQATKLFVTQASQDSLPYENALPQVSTSPDLCAQGHTTPK